MATWTKVAAGAIGALAGRAAYAEGVRAMMRRNTAKMMAGDPGPLLATYHPDVVMTFPGDSSWGRTYRGRDELAGFFRRFLDVGLRGELGAIFIEGPPWATRIAVEFFDHADDPATGERIYENRAVLVMRARWGRVVAEEVYEDTQKSAALDEHLAARAAGAAA